MEYLTRQFTEPQNDMEGLKSFRTPLGLAVMADTSAMGEAKIILNVDRYVPSYLCSCMYMYMYMYNARLLCSTCRIYLSVMTKIFA